MSLSFGTNTVEHRFRQLHKNAEAFRSDALNNGLAVQIAQDAWSLVEIAHHELRLASALPQLGDFRRQVKDECPELAYMQDISNEHKHGEITKYTPRLKEARSTRGAFSQSFSRSFNISRLELVTETDQVLWFEDVMDTVVGYWQEKLTEMNAI